MKIALCIFRGIEGAGVSRFCIETSAFLIKYSIEHVVYVLDDKKWGRGKFQTFPQEPVMVTKAMLHTFSDTLNTFDYVFINSVPSVKHSQWAQDGFLDMVKNITSKKIIFQNDHKIASIWRNANFFELCNLCDGIVSHSITSPFYNKLISLYGSDIKKKFVQLHVGFDFEQLQKFRKKEHHKEIMYLGRYATFKQERIPNHRMVEVNKKAIENGLQIDNDKRDLDKIYIFGPYNYVDGMESLSNSLIGCDFYHLDAMAYGSNFEYAQCEIIGVSCVPMFDHHWAENCSVYDIKGNDTGKKFIDLDTYGLFVKKDLSNIEETVDKINDIWNNKSLHKKYLECSYEITKAHCDSNWIFQKLLNDIATLEKAKITKTKALF